MTVFVVDSSVAAQWLLDDDHSDLASLLLDSHHERLAPDFVLTEIGNILWKRVGRADIEPDDARRMLRTFPRYIRLHESRPLVGTALEIALSIGQTVYDCLYLALAESAGVALVTADRSLYRAATRRNPATSIWIEDLPAALA